MFEKYREKIIEYWKNAQKSRKISIIAITLVVIILIIFLINNATRVRYSVLYSGLSLQDQSKITTALDELNIPYQLQGSNTIIVPADVVDKTRVDLAGKNLPSSGYDYDKMFQDTSWSQTEFDKTIRLQRLKEATLEKSIMSIEGIDEATVMLEIPDNTNFVLSDQEILPTASVYISWDGGGSRKNEIVKSIQNLVAHSTIKLTQDNVSVTDNFGNTLTTISSDTSVSAESYAYARNIASTYEQKIRNLLETIIGKGNANVIVNVELDMDLKKEVEKKYNPPVEGEEGGIIRSQELLNEEMIGQGAEGAPGTETNVEDNVLQEGAGNKYTKNQSTTNYELNEFQSETRKSPGQIREISVAVVLNTQALPGEELTPTLQKEYEDMVRASVGSKATNISISSQVFTPLPEREEPQEPNIVQKYWPIFLIVLLVLIGIIVFLFIRQKKKKQEEAELQALLEEEERQRKLKQQESDEPEDLDFDAEESKMKRQIEMFIEQDPEAVVQLLRNWLNE